MIKKYYVYAVLFLTSLLYNAVCTAQMAKSKEQQMINSQQGYWTIDYALSLPDQIANLSYGIKNLNLFEKLVAQKNKGDPNALYAYAELLEMYNTINEQVGLTPEQASDEAFSIYWKLSELGHPQACKKVVNYGMHYVLTKIEMSKQELLNKQFHCINTAIKYHLYDYGLYADILIFEFEQDQALRLLLQDARKPQDIKQLERAIIFYKNYATSQTSNYAYGVARLAEAYEQGIGVGKDYIISAVWARIYTEAVKNGSNKYHIYAYKLNDKYSWRPSIIDSDEFKKKYKEIKESLPK